MAFSKILRIRKQFMRMRTVHPAHKHTKKHTRAKGLKEMYICEMRGTHNNISVMCSKLRKTEHGIAGFFDDIKIFKFNGEFVFEGKYLDKERARFLGEVIERLAPGRKRKKQKRYSKEELS